MYNTTDALLGAIMGATIGVVGTYIGAVSLANHNSKRVAGMRLRETFGLERAIISDPKSNFLKVAEIIKSRFIDQQMAVDEFRLFLTSKELGAFNKVWNEYYQQKCQGIELPMYREWQYISDQTEKEKAVNLIEQIIAFTKPDKGCLFHNLFDKAKQ